MSASTRVRHAALLTLALLIVATLMFAAYRFGQRRAAAQLELPGPVDIGFVQTMRGHHDQAVVIAQILLERGDTRLAGLARSIETAQLIEIGEMKGWLLSWRKPLLPMKAGMDWMLLGSTPPDTSLTRYLADCRASPGGMPGLATNDELDQLRHLDGDARDRLFLQLMIRHHEGALPMARFAARNAETEMVRALAAEMLMHQMQEVAAMTLMRQRLAAP